MSAVRVGVFIVAGLVVFSVGIFLIAQKQYLFKKTYRLSAAFDSVAGLSLLLKHLLPQTLCLTPLMAIAQGEEPGPA